MTAPTTDTLALTSVECGPSAVDLHAGDETRTSKTYHADNEQSFFDLLRRRIEENDRRRFVASLRRLGLPAGESIIAEERRQYSHTENARHVHRVGATADAPRERLGLRR
jgi:hypothetical protein